MALLRLGVLRTRSFPFVTLTSHLFPNWFDDIFYVMFNLLKVFDFTLFRRLPNYMQCSVDIGQKALNFVLLLSVAFFHQLLEMLMQTS